MAYRLITTTAIKRWIHGQFHARGTLGSSAGWGRGLCGLRAGTAAAEPTPPLHAGPATPERGCGPGARPAGRHIRVPGTGPAALHVRPEGGGPFQRDRGDAVHPLRPPPLRGQRRAGNPGGRGAGSVTLRGGPPTWRAADPLRQPPPFPPPAPGDPQSPDAGGTGCGRGAWGLPAHAELGRRDPAGKRTVCATTAPGDDRCARQSGAVSTRRIRLPPPR